MTEFVIGGGIEIGTDHHKLEPIPVRITGTEITESRQPEIGAYSSVIDFSVINAALMVLPQDKRRKRAVLFYTDTGASALVLGDRGKVSNNHGFILGVNQSLVIESQAAVWVMPYVGQGIIAPSNGSYLSILDEHYLE